MNVSIPYRFNERSGSKASHAATNLFQFLIGSMKVVVAVIKWVYVPCFNSL